MCTAEGLQNDCLRGRENNGKHKAIGPCTKVLLPPDGHSHLSPLTSPGQEGTKRGNITLAPGGPSQRHSNPPSRIPRTQRPTECPCDYSAITRLPTSTTARVLKAGTANDIESSSSANPPYHKLYSTTKGAYRLLTQTFSSN